MKGQEFKIMQLGGTCASRNGVVLAGDPVPLLPTARGIYAKTAKTKITAIRNGDKGFIEK